MLNTEQEVYKVVQTLAPITLYQYYKLTKTKMPPRTSREILAKLLETGRVKFTTQNPPRIIEVK